MFFVRCQPHVLNFAAFKSPTPRQLSSSAPLSGEHGPARARCTIHGVGGRRGRTPGCRRVCKAYCANSSPRLTLEGWASSSAGYSDAERHVGDVGCGPRLGNALAKSARHILSVQRVASRPRAFALLQNYISCVLTRGRSRAARVLDGACGQICQRRFSHVMLLSTGIVSLAAASPS